MTARQTRARLLTELADRLERWRFPPGSDALAPMALLVSELRREATHLTRSSDPTVSIDWVRSWLMEAALDFDRGEFMDHVESVLAETAAAAWDAGFAQGMAPNLRRPVATKGEDHVE